VLPQFFLPAKAAGRCASISRRQPDRLKTREFHAPFAEDHLPRRRVRLSCVLRHGSDELPGATSSVGQSALQLRLSHPLAHRIGPGERVLLRLALPDQREPLRVDAEVSWAAPEEQHAAARCAVVLGLKLGALSEDDAERLARFVASFRHLAVIADASEASARALLGVMQEDFRVLICAAWADAEALIRAHEVAVLVCGERLAEGSGVQLLRRHAAELDRLQVVRIACASNLLDAQVEELVNLGGAFHVLRLPWRPSELRQVLRRAVDAHVLLTDNERLDAELQRAHDRLRRENTYLRHRLEAHQGFERILGASAALREAFSELERIRGTDTSVHLQGETGSGKELVARALHEGGPRASRPFVAQSCAGLPQTLLHSALFGHRRGAFTGAERDHPGVFEQAQGGTLFLDEVAELSLASQGMLLRALQEREVMPLGGTQVVPVDVRIISATHADLREEIRAGRFREDLYFRLVVLRVRLPPLRERHGDVPVLARHFLQLHAQRFGRKVPALEPSALSALEGWPWPGNVRELENEMERLVVLSEEGEPLTVELLSPHLRAAAAPALQPQILDEGVVIPRGLPFEEAVGRLERIWVERALEAAGGNVTRAAALLGIERSRLSKIRTRLLQGPGRTGEEE
jgi:two-component system, NtrC family, response regulator HupR/HoxA